MRIDRLDLHNFKKFKEETFEFPRSVNAPADAGSFHVLIGENGSGKTSVLDALAVALGVWLVKVPDSSLANSRRPILPAEKRLELVQSGDRTLFQEAAGDVSVKAFGCIEDHDCLSWEQRIAEGRKRASNAGSKEAIDIVQKAYARAKASNEVVLPVIAYYGAARAWLPHHERSKFKAKSNRPARRWGAFYDCLNERIRLTDLASWFQGEAIAKGNRGGNYRPGFEVVRRAVLRSVRGASDIWYDGDRGEIVLAIDDNAQPLSNLSAGQRTMLALVADIAIKAVTQNNFLVPSDALTDEDEPLPRVLDRTPGVVLIDELDVHLHPKWQRAVVEDLRSVFPRVQFIGTTHSPFIVQSLREDELINLQGQPVPNLGKLSVETIVQGLMGVERPDVSQRYEKMVDAAKSYLLTLEEAAKAPADKLAEYEQRLAAGIAPYADNPAFQAFLELKHTAKLGRKPATEDELARHRGA
ncbi:MAG: AAA family ATPase [Planctomycetes bacterium]|nr:AAA family ATPase [Planctomycetota bacterium]